MEIKKLVKNQIRIDDEPLDNKSIVLNEQEQTQLLRFFKKEKPVLFMDVVTE